PCQPFSLMGKKRGSNDPRSNIMLHCIEVITIKQPSIFILENVKSFKSIDDGKSYKYLINTLENISNYTIYTDILNTRDYGIPHNRERIFIIGIKNVIMIDDYIKPQKTEMKKQDECILDKKIYTFKSLDKMLLKNLSIVKEKTNDNVIFVPFTYAFPTIDVCPTLTTRCSSFYHSVYNRHLNYKEALMLQGFDTNFNKVVSNFQLCKQIGNSMSVNVLKVIFQELFRCTVLSEL
ncbi:S-adenosyl-L-methionine-dependent methyltransferase, partial [Zopfochytrium polystomum]